MVNSDTGLGEDIHQHSGWLIPLGVALAIALLSALFLVYYLRPVPALFRGSPSAAATPVALTVGGVHLSVPANYIDNRAARGGGNVQTLDLFALLPDFKGYTPQAAANFQDNGPASPVVHIVLRAGAALDAESRLSRIYQPYMDRVGAPGPFGLVQYGFRAGSGYGRNDLFAGRRHGKPILFLCERPAQDLTGPNCLASERSLAPSLTLSYRFKRARLSDWSRIDDGVTALAASFLRR